MNRNLLIIDDEEINRKLIRMLINRISENFKIFEAKTGKEALKTIEEIEFDMILVDILLPDMNGIEIIKNIKNKKTKIVILSALSENEVINSKTPISPEIQYLSKPIDIEKFSRLIKELE
jgi:YesN/AraC family two-component response regulator